MLIKYDYVINILIKYSKLLYVCVIVLFILLLLSWYLRETEI
jgi:hypothetical protein